MKLLNLGCGGARIPGDEWINLDDLHAQLPEGSGAREELDKETNYLNFNLNFGPLPFNENEFDGILASHFFEHFDCQQGLKIMVDCKRILKCGGALLVSVPDASYFRKVYAQDRKENWPQLFDVDDPNNTYTTFSQAALWFNEHHMIFTEDALWSYFRMAGFKQFDDGDFRMLEANLTRCGDEKSCTAAHAMIPHLNRRKFSLERCGIKP